MRLLLLFVVLPLVSIVLSSVLLSVPSPLRTYLLPDEESASGEVVHFDATSTLEQTPPSSLIQSFPNGSEVYHFGRWRSPIENPSLHRLTPVQKLFQQKEWHFIAIADGEGRRLFGFAVAQLQYASSAFVYMFDSANNHTIQKNVIMPGGFGATISSSSVEGCSNWTSPHDLISTLKVSLCALPSHPSTSSLLPSPSKGWTVEAEGVLNDVNFHFKATVGALRGTVEPLVLSYPIGPHRAAYTHKEAGTPARGLYRLEFNAKQASRFTPAPTDYGLGDSVALVDWTRSMQKRFTVWYWVAIALTAPNGKRIGINLSHGVYPNPNDGGDLENGIWVEGKLHAIDSKLYVQGRPGEGAVVTGKPWRCWTGDGDDTNRTIDLTFVRQGAVDSQMNLGILSGNLIHTFGTWNGWVVVDGEKIQLRNVVGILEDHHALW